MIKGGGRGGGQVELGVEVRRDGREESGEGGAPERSEVSVLLRPLLNNSCPVTLTRSQKRIKRRRRRSFLFTGGNCRVESCCPAGFKEGFRHLVYLYFDFT